ncbi:MAG TPA: magnesium transporter [Burkholderiales bacterium]
MTSAPNDPQHQVWEQQRRMLIPEAKSLAPGEAATLLAEYPAQVVAGVLQGLHPATAQDIIAELPHGMVDGVMRALPAETARQWQVNQSFAPGSIGRMMEPALAVFRPELTVGEAIEALRALIQSAFITYAYVTDPGGRLLGVVTMRDLLFTAHAARLDSVMLRDVFFLKPDLPLSEAMKLVLDRHYPVYPVCDGNGVLVGLVRGQVMFEEQAFEITAQVGTMVGVEKEERLATHWSRSFKFRHPWLQLNLLTAFVAGAVVAIFQDTVDRLVILALFLPVLAGQSGNTGCQALAVTLRGLTLGELKAGKEKALVMKEASLGFMNGAFTGIVAAGGMYYVATYQQNPNAIVLSIVVWLALVGSCVASGICGAMVPLTLKRFGADPATASSIFLTTATDVVSMGLLLGLATLIIR